MGRFLKKKMLHLNTEEWFHQLVPSLLSNDHILIMNNINLQFLSAAVNWVIAYTISMKRSLSHKDHVYMQEVIYLRFSLFLCNKLIKTKTQ